jgi:hypothetical protein
MDRLILRSYLYSLIFAPKTLENSCALTDLDLWIKETVIERIIIRLLFSFRVRPGCLSEYKLTGESNFARSFFPWTNYSSNLVYFPGPKFKRENFVM